MRLLAGSFRVLTLGAAAAALRERRLPRRSLAITFDDGYADNAEVALPILQRHGLRASFFVATGFLDGGRMFNDSVIECLRRTPLARVDLGEFGLGRADLRDTRARRAAVEALLPKVKYLPPAERGRAVVRLHAACGSPLLPDDLMMRSEQVRQLHRAGMEIGGHTVGHPILSALPDAEARREIADGRERLQSLIDAAVDVFAYPNGMPGTDYDARHVAMLRELGLRAAVSTAPGVARPGADLLQLPRFTPWDRRPARWMARLLWERLQGRPGRTAEAAP